MSPPIAIDWSPFAQAPPLSPYFLGPVLSFPLPPIAIPWLVWYEVLLSSPTMAFVPMITLKPFIGPGVPLEFFPWL